MNWRSKLTQHWRSGVTGTLLAMLAGWSLLMIPSLANLSYDWLFALRPDISVEGVNIVYMDEASHRELERRGARYDGPWNRALHAELVERLTAYHAKAVVFDVLFESALTNTLSEAQADQRLLQAVRKHGKVVLAGKRTPITREGGAFHWSLTAPFPELRTNATWGVVEEGGEGERAIREHFTSLAEQPSMAYKVAELTMTNPPPRYPKRTRWVNYYGPSLSIPSESFYKVLDTNSRSLIEFSNKVVFVGAHVNILGHTGTRGLDYFRTPYSRWTDGQAPGVEINATTYLNLQRGDWLTRLPPAAQMMLSALTGLLFGFGLSGFRPVAAVGAALAGILAVVLGAALLFSFQHLWFSWLAIAVGQIPVALASSLLSQASDLRLEKAVLEAQLATARASASAPAPAPQPAPYTDKPTMADSPAGVGPPLGALPHAPGLSSFFNSPGVSPEMAARAAAAAGQQPPPFIPDHTLLRRVGKGAYGEVWLARDVIGSYHAVKVVYRSSFDDPAPYEREFNGIKKFTPISRSHPGFVQILHVGRNDTVGYIHYIMEVGDDETSGQKIDPASYTPKNLAKELRKRGRLPVHESLELALALASALDHLHRHRLIHRDIKPSNIIFVSDAPKFADIGLVTEVAGTGRDVTFLGTKGYIAPEGPGTPAADVYSLGKVIYEACMGLELERYPELPTTLVERADTEEVFELNNIILKACEPDIQKRYRSASELHADLVRLRTRLHLPRSG